jgi:hypothetical protein
MSGFLDLTGLTDCESHGSAPFLLLRKSSVRSTLRSL